MIQQIVTLKMMRVALKRVYKVTSMQVIENVLVLNIVDVKGQTMIPLHTIEEIHALYVGDAHETK